MAAKSESVTLSRLRTFLRRLPIHQVIEEGFDVIGASVAIVDVVRMLPYVAAEDRRGTVHDWQVGGGVSLALNAIINVSFDLPPHSPDVRGNIDFRVQFWFSCI